MQINVLCALRNLHCAWPIFRSIKRDIYVVGDFISTFSHSDLDHLATGVTKKKKATFLSI
jgi:hypothetical protein